MKNIEERKRNFGLADEQVILVDTWLDHLSPQDKFIMDNQSLGYDPERIFIIDKAAIDRNKKAGVLLLRLELIEYSSPAMYMQLTPLAYKMMAAGGWMAYHHSSERNLSSTILETPAVTTKTKSISNTALAIWIGITSSVIAAVIAKMLGLV